MNHSIGMSFGPKHPWFDDRRAPLVVMHLPAVFTDDALQDALDEVSRWLLDDVEALFGFVADFARPLGITARQRQMMATAEQRYVHVDRRYNAGQAVVVSSAITRGVLTAIYWISPPVYPYTLCGSLDEAFAWLEPQFARFAARHPRGVAPGERRSVT